MIIRLTFAITGSKKRGDEGAPLFTVRVDGVVRPGFHGSLDKMLKPVQKPCSMSCRLLLIRGP